MMDKVVRFVANKDYIVPRMLITNYKQFNITSDELIFIIYLINNSEDFNPKKISLDLNLDLNETMELINSLTTKGLIALEVKKVDNIRTEYINLNQIYKKIAFKLVEDEEEKNNNNIFDKFEKEFGRTLSPMEYEIINSWTETMEEETILLALKEAVYNGVNNLRYIDKILYEWQKKGIKTEEDILKNKKNFISKKEVKETFDYDWLNNE